MRSLPCLLCAACGAAAPSPSPSPPGGAPLSFAIRSPAELVARGVVSSEYGEVRLAPSPDGKALLWGSTDRPGGPGGWDVWISRRTGDAWSAPAPAPFDTPAKEFDPAFSPDGRWVYFFSNRPGGAGGDDLYRAAVTGDGFGPAEHLGPEVNTPGDEWAPSPSPDGAQLMFATNRPGAKHDLYSARVRGDGFAPAEPLPGAVNTPDHDEFDAAFLADGSSIAFTRSTDVDSDPLELYFATRGPTGYGAGTRLPDAINVAGGYTFGPAIDAVDRSVLYFTSKRPEDGAGKLDIYRIRYELAPAR